jgi:hypothetical protein
MTVTDRLTARFASSVVVAETLATLPSRLGPPGGLAMTQASSWSPASCGVAETVAEARSVLAQ